MSWSVRLWFVGFFASLNLAVLGCGAGRTWPTVRAQADHRFMAYQRTLRTVDILPLDVQVWTHPGSQTHPHRLAEQFQALASGAVVAELSKRGYQIGAQIDWNGNYVAPDGEVRTALGPEKLDMTTHSLSGYGRAVADTDQGLLVPYLPHRLGVATRSDATLYVGGWAYSGQDKRESTGKKVAKGIAIGLLIAVVIVVAIVGLKKSGRALGKVAGGATRAAGGAARVAARTGKAAARAVFRASRAARPLLRGIARTSRKIAGGALRAGDAFGHAVTHIDIYAGRPDYFTTRATPKRGPSRMYIELTLIDNATGTTLWHTRETFPAACGREKDVSEVFGRLFATLPGQ